MQKHLDMRTQHKTAINSGTQANAPEMRLRMIWFQQVLNKGIKPFFSAPRLSSPQHSLFL